MTPDDLVSGMVAHGLPEPVAQIYAAFDVAIARGELATVSDVVLRTTGEPARSLADFLRASRAAFISTAS